MQTKEEGIVRLIATNKKYERAPFYMAPELGFDKKPVYYFNNDPSLSQEDKDAFASVLNFTEISDEDGVIKLQHLMKLRLDNVRDRALFYYIKNMPDSLGIVAKNKSSSTAAKHRFYIENKEVEAKSSVEKMAVKMKALMIANEILTGMSPENDTVRDALRLIGIPIKGLSTVLCQSSLLSEADTNPKRFLEILDDKYRDYKIYIVKCIEQGLLYKNKSGSYAYNTRENVIAMNDHQMIAFLQDRGNENLVRMWADTIKDNRIVSKQTFSTVEIDSDNLKKTSAKMNVKDAVAFIELSNDADVLKGFILGEERPAILQTANKKIDKLTE